MITHFVAGTDTGVGKTRVAAGLTQALIDSGLRVAVMKPVATGAARTPQGLRNDDAQKLLALSNVPASYERINPYCFEPAIAPHIAAREAGVTVDIAVIQAHHAALATQADELVIEGTGGWLAPINETQTMADIAVALGARILLVVGLRLGCLNHALLTRRAIEASGARWNAWIANTLEPDMPRLAENISSLERLLGGPPVDVVPYNPAPGW